MCTGSSSGKAMLFQQMQMNQQLTAQRAQATQQMQQQEAQFRQSQETAKAEAAAEAAKSAEEKAVAEVRPVRAIDDEAMAVREEALRRLKQRDGYASTLVTGGKFGQVIDPNRYQAAGVPVLLT